MATFCGLVSTSRGPFLEISEPYTIVFRLLQGFFSILFIVLGHHSGTRIPFRIQKHGTLVAGNFSPINMVRGLCVNHNFYMHAVSRGSNYMLEFDDKNEMHSTWIDSFKQLIRGLKVVLVFLAAQPSQLRYIEWPSFQSTLKTAMLTLVLVSVLIVALSSVDAALSYLLAVLLR